jgi:ABC-type multidrug transport system ATPase subunit
MALELSGVAVTAGKATLLQGLDLSFGPGQLVGLIGPSGAGKSTLIKVLLGIREPSAGTVRLNGQPVQAAGPVGYVPQDDALHGSLRVQDALLFAAELRMPTWTDAARRSRVEQVIQQVGLEERQTVAIHRLSGGQRKRVSVAMELLTSPPVLILDEPTSGLDPGMEAKMMELFQAVAQAGRIVLVSTHAMQSLERCSRLLVLMQGRMIFGGSPEQAPDWFGARSLNGIFDQLPTQSPETWARKWATGRAALAQSTPVQLHAQLKVAAGPAGLDTRGGDTRSGDTRSGDTRSGVSPAAPEFLSFPKNFPSSLRDPALLKQLAELKAAREKKE